MNWGNRLNLTIFGESHGEAIGAVLEGLPAGEEIDLPAVLAQMARRAPGADRYSTQRRESDEPQILSGLLDGRTTGAPLCAVIANADRKSADYAALREIPRPGHADYPARLRYGGFCDLRGGGRFSGRMTAPLVFAGAVCRQILRRRGVVIGSHAASVHGVRDTPFDPVSVSAELLESLSQKRFPVLSAEAERAMLAEIEKARLAQDSVGGVVECAAAGLPAGAGGPLWEGAESSLASLLFAVPACRGVDFGSGFSSAELRGSENNDPYFYDAAGAVKTRTNHAGGILGGMTTGMPLVFRAAFKPTPSIASEQESVDLSAHTDARLRIQGRHDPCIAARAAVIVESAAAVSLLDLLLSEPPFGGNQNDA